MICSLVVYIHVSYQHQFSFPTFHSRSLFQDLAATTQICNTRLMYGIITPFIRRVLSQLLRMSPYQTLALVRPALRSS